jgi:polysaccharide chain length determinant protein (PEP-CTERM system associated)
MQEEARRTSAVEVVRSVWSRRKWLAIVVFTVPLVAAVSLIMFLPNVYRSGATVLVDRQQVPESMVRPTVTSALETRLHTISQEILSRSRLEALINRFGLYADLRKRVSEEEVIERMRKDIRLDLKSVKQDEYRGVTIAFTISYEGRDPETVARVANTLASFYIEENLKVRERQAAGTSEFLKVQLAEVKRRLDQQEGTVSEFKKRYLGELPQQMDSNLGTIERLNQQLRLNSDNQTRALERREAIARQLMEAGSFSSTATGPEAGIDQLTRLNEELRRLRTVYSDKYPDVVRLKQEIASLERELAEGRTTPATTREAPKTPPTSNPYVLRLRQAQSDVESEINILKGEEKRLRAALVSYIGRVENAPKREQEFRELSRDYESTRENYASLMKRYEEAQLAENMEQRQKGEQFRVIDPAFPSGEPTAPNRLRYLIMALVASGALAIASVVLAEQLNASFHSVDDLRALSAVPVLLSIPLIVTADDTARRLRRFRMGTASFAVALVLIIGVSWFVAHGNEQLVSFLSRGK